MEGGFLDDLRQLEFFPGTQAEKQGDSCMPVVSTQLTQPADHLNQGIYQDEQSVDFSSIIEAYNLSENTSIPSSATSTSVPSGGTPERQEAAVSSTSNFSTFSEYLSPDLSSLAAHTSMYGSENYGNPMHGQMDMTPSPPAMSVVDCIGVPATPSPHVVQIDNSGMSTNFTALRPAPGKAQRSGKAGKKGSMDKNSLEYRQKRDRNNVAVRKSREKSKVRVLDTEKRVRELEDENTQLQSKIALLSKELNVLKSLFTSAGVSQPPSFHLKDERRTQK
jgi:hypothetical protein